MEKLPEFLELLRRHNLVVGRLRGLFHLVIGRKITAKDGTLISAGVTWRELSNILKDLRFDRELVTEVGAIPEDLSPRDRQRFWYSAIALSRPDSIEARTDAEKLIAAITPLGYVVGPAPSPPPQKSLSSPMPPPPSSQNDDDDASGKKKKKK